MTASEVLSKAADLIEPKGSWTQHHYALRRDGRSVWWDDPLASCYCAGGAVAKVAGGRTAASMEALWILEKVLQQDIPTWNDNRRRTQAEVVAALRKAASLSKVQNGEG